VPLGAFLSGGLDSSAIVAEMSATAGRISTYTVGFSKEDLAHEIVPDDVRYSRRAARELDLDYHERILEADVVALLPQLVWHMDEPVADPAAITTHLICAAARDRLTVILSGMGGDEIFAGYPRYLAAKWGRIAALLPRPARSAISRTVAERLTMGRPGRLRGPRRNVMKFARGLDLEAEDRYLTHSSYYQPGELDRVLRPDLRGDRPRSVPPAPQLLRARPRRALAQPAAVRGPEDVPAVPQPHVHGQDEHGDVDGGSCAAAG
jgi:asparagine synthase (glutamine-hydrolysing)